MHVKEKLSSFHIALLIYMIQLDVTAFAVPRLVAENFGTNGWLGLIVLSGIVLLNLLLYRIVYRLGKGASVFELAEASVPKPLLVPLYVLLALFWVALGAMIGKHFILIFRLISFQTTNPMLIFVLFCFMVYALLTKTIYGISKASTVFFFLSIWMLVLIVYFWSDWKLLRFTNFWFQGAENGGIVHNWAEVYAVFVGYELCMFLFPFTDAKSRLFRGVFIGHLTFTFVLLVTTWVAFGFFSFEQLKMLQYPLISMLEYIELPFINRVENLVFTFFLFSNLMSTVMFCFAGLTTLRRVFPRARRKLLEASVVCAAYGIGWIPQILRQSMLLLRFMFYTEMGLAFVIPVLLIPLAWRYRTKKGGDATS
ncbi:GerAB/ArcD/ProY family transporter [Paenibacillus sp. GYB003]|uniref:GerAB/ArcD/ProY family transporter n=1 Tax=Paenibacillus sp. GYB003 TaxID=2994392 RepID=UPI002F96228D